MFLLNAQTNHDSGLHLQQHLQQLLKPAVNQILTSFIAVREKRPTHPPPKQKGFEAPAGYLSLQNDTKTVTKNTARWGHPTPSPSLWERCRNVTVCPVTSCKVQLKLDIRGIFFLFFPHLKNFPDQSMRIPGAVAPPLRRLLPHVTFYPPSSLSRWGRGERSAAPWLLWEAYGWHKIDGVIGRSSRVVIRHGWLMVLLCVVWIQSH